MRPLEFNDAGRNGDEVAGDGTWTGSFQPSRQGFAMFEGTLRVEFRVRANGKSEGGAFFDIVFTPAPPATFTGKVREVVEQGSLQLYVGLQVRKPGRFACNAKAGGGVFSEVEEVRSMRFSSSSDNRAASPPSSDVTRLAAEPSKNVSTRCFSAVRLAACRGTTGV